MIENEISDEQLIIDYRAGHTGAMDRLLTRYQDRVFQFVLWRTRADRVEGEDLAQEVLLQVFRSAKSFDGRSRFRTWLYAVAGNVCSRWLRSRSRRPPFEANGNAQGESIDTLEMPDGTPGAQEALERGERHQAVRSAVRQLEPQHQVVLLLRDWEELSYAEISTVLNIPQGTVKSRLHHARLRLGKLLSPATKGEVR